VLHVVSMFRDVYDRRSSVYVQLLRRWPKKTSV